MVYSYNTHSKQGRYYYISFRNVMEDTQLLVKFLPNTPMVFDKDKVNLQQMKMRDPEVLLACLEEYGITLITKGLS